MKKALFLFLCLLTSCLTSCFGPSTKSSKPIVLVTIPTYAYFVEQIAGDTVSVKIFVQPGSNPHIYEPTPKQVESFAKAQIWLRNGDPIEGKILKFMQEKHIKNVDLSEGLSLLTSSGHSCDDHDSHVEGKDLHVWLDPNLAAIQAKTIAQELKILWPEHQAMYEDRLQLLENSLQKLDEDIEKQLEPLKGSYLLLSHPALGYYCARYGLNQLSVECQGKDPRPQQIAEIVKEAKEKNVRVVLTEPQYNNKGATLIAEKLNLPLYQIDPYAQDYLKSMNEITQAIVKFYADQS